MPASVELKENGRVLHFIFHDPLNHQEINAVEDQAKAWYDAAKTKLHIFIDVSNLHHLPEGFLRVRGNYEITHPNAGQIAVLGSSTFVKAMAETILRVARVKRAKFFETQREADAWTHLLDIIKQEEASAGVLVKA